ncbi:DNA-binding protein [Pseudoclavibacter helvolus]|uniref:DNA-binding protein n=1 Tax=Pseudoclavibacter helvolus TaxID=255205 RepID=UPI0037350ECB
MDVAQGAVVEDAASRAKRAVDDLAAAGLAVTARAVRERAGVRMGVAADAARAHAEDVAAAGAIPEIPEAVAGRLEAVWREAVMAARGEHADAVTGWTQRLEDAHAERDDAAAELDRVETLLASTVTERDEALTDLATARSEVMEARARADDEARTLRDRLDTALHEHAELGARSAAAEARAETLQAVLDRLQPRNSSEPNQ